MKGMPSQWMLSASSGKATDGTGETLLDRIQLVMASVLQLAVKTTEDEFRCPNETRIEEFAAIILKGTKQLSARLHTCYGDLRPDLRLIYFWALGRMSLMSMKNQPWKTSQVSPLGPPAYLKVLLPSKDVAIWMQIERRGEVQQLSITAVMLSH